MINLKTTNLITLQKYKFPPYPVLIICRSNRMVLKN